VPAGGELPAGFSQVWGWLARWPDSAATRPQLLQTYCMAESLSCTRAASTAEHRRSCTWSCRRRIAQVAVIGDGPTRLAGICHKQPLNGFEVPGSKGLR
jgi:hypothetical protein